MLFFWIIILSLTNNIIGGEIIKVVLQDGIKDCGVCCLLSIIRYYGGDVSKEYLRELTNTTKDGVSLYNLLYASIKLGFDSSGVMGTINEINVNNLPCIAHINVNKSIQHFIVVYKINKEKKQITIMDPAKGKKVISFSEFNLLTSKNFLFLTPKKKLPILKKKNMVYRIIRRLLLENKKIIFTISTLTINYFIINIIISFHFKYLLEYSINYNVSNNIFLISIIIVTIYIFKNTIQFLRSILLNKWNSLFDISINENTYKQILLLPYQYFKNRTTGEIIARFKDLNIVKDYLTTLFCTTSTDLISILIFSVIMFKYNKMLLLIINIHVIIIILYTLRVNRQKKKKINIIKKKEDIINSYLIQGISNVDTIKGSHLEKRIIDKFTLNYKAFQEMIYNYNHILEQESLIKSLISDSIYIFVYGLGSLLVIKEKIE